MHRRQKKEVFSRLPVEIQVDIFLRLPIDSILSCRHVCLAWRSLLCSQNFIKTHLDHGIRNPKLMLKSCIFENNKCLFGSRDYASISSASSKPYTESTSNVHIPVGIDFHDMLYNTIRMLGSCNGLVCMSLNLFKDICIWNPSTGEYKIIQIPLFGDSDDTGKCGFGFYYDCTVDDYKLARVTEENNSGAYRVDVYTLGSKLTKTFQTTNHYMFPVTTCAAVSAFLVNGALHWLGFNNTKGVSSGVIVSFDVSSERFVDVLLPKEVQIRDTHGVYQCSIGVLEDCLCLGIDHIQRIDVWSMQDYGVGDSWTRRFSFSTIRMSGIFAYHYNLKLLWSFTNGELLFDCAYGKIVYDPKYNSFRVLKDQGDSRVIGGVPLNYVQSLVSPNSIV